MAKFKFLGIGQEFDGLVAQMGGPIEFRFDRKGPGKKVHKPKGGKAKFDVGDVIEEDDERAVRHLRADPRFEEVP